MEPIKIIKLILLLFLFLQCHRVDKKTTADIGKIEIQIESKNNWKKDSLGCLNLRNLDLAKELIEKNSLIGKSQESFIKIFGSPNEIKNNTEQDVFIYYTNTICREENIVRGADKCWIQFNFIDNKLVTIPDVFACE